MWRRDMAIITRSGGIGLLLKSALEVIVTQVKWVLQKAVK